jgi:putative ABC transport system substrate-binding protein
MRRREFIAGLGSVAAWPLAVRAQQPQPVRRIGVLLPTAADDAAFQAWVGGFLQELALLGWTIGRNVRIDTRWAGANTADIRRHAVELAALAPDVILAAGAFDTALGKYAMAYADKADQDFESFRHAAASGQIKTETSPV